MTEIMTEKLKKDPVGMSVHLLVKVMSTDYASSFNKSFNTDEDKRFLKRRLYTALKEVSPEVVIDAYQVICDQRPEFMPSVGQIISEAKRLEGKKNRSIEEKEGIERYAQLPKPTVQCNPVEILANTKCKAGEKKRTTGEWVKDKELARLALQATVAGIKPRHADHNHLCGYGGCNKSGSMSHSTNSSENWYCAKHFRME